MSPPPYHTSCADAGAKIVAFTEHQTALLPYADTVIRLPAQPPAASDQLQPFASCTSVTARTLVQGSVLPLDSAYELALHLLLDTLAVMLQQKNSVSDELTRSRLSNLE